MRKFTLLASTAAALAILGQAQASEQTDRLISTNYLLRNSVHNQHQELGDARSRLSQIRSEYAELLRINRHLQDLHNRKLQENAHLVSQLLEAAKAR